MTDAVKKVMAEWPNLKPEWAVKYASFLDREVAAAVAQATQPLQARTTELEAELTKAQGALDYERNRCDVYAAKNAALSEEVQTTRTLAASAAKVAEGIPTEDIEGLLQPGRYGSRIQYIGALGRVSQWLDAIQATMAESGIPFVELGNPEAKGQVELEAEQVDVASVEQASEAEPVPALEPAPEASTESGNG